MVIKQKSVFCVFIFYFLFPFEFGFCLGLSSTMGEVILENLTIGATYSVVQQSGMYLEVLNRGDVPVSLRIDVTKPKNIPEDLKEGYEPIPSTDWVKVEKILFSEIPPGEKAVTDITITIPDDKKHYGKRYQVYLWSRTVPQKGSIVAAGLIHRVLFSIAKKKKGFFGKLFIFLHLKKK